jgi:hypothetical protein
MVKQKILTKDIKKYRKDYKARPHVIKRRKQRLIKYECICGGKFDSEHKNWHLKSKRHQRYEAMKAELEDFEVPLFETIENIEKVFEEPLDDIGSDFDIDFGIDSDIEIDSDIDIDFEIDSDIDIDFL